MNNNFNLKKIGTLIILVASCIMLLGNISVLIQYNAIYGSIAGLGGYMAFDVISLGATYYFCTRKFNVDSIFAYRQAARGPLLGLAYFIICLNLIQVSIVHISFAVGCILVLIADIQLVNEARANRKKIKEQNL